MRFAVLTEADLYELQIQLDCFEISILCTIYLRESYLVFAYLGSLYRPAVLKLLTSECAVSRGKLAVTWPFRFPNFQPNSLLISPPQATKCGVNIYTNHQDNKEFQQSTLVRPIPVACSNVISSSE